LGLHIGMSDIVRAGRESALAYADDGTIFRMQALVIPVRGASSSFPNRSELSDLAEPGTRMARQRVEGRNAIEYHRGDQSRIVDRIAPENGRRRCYQGRCEEGCQNVPGGFRRVVLEPQMRTLMNVSVHHS
jgi:hypothetical protein